MDYVDEIKKRLDMLDSLKNNRPGIGATNCPYRIGSRIINKTLDQRIQQYRRALLKIDNKKGIDILKSVLSLENYLKKGLISDDTGLYERVFDLYKEYRKNFRKKSQMFIEQLFTECINKLKTGFLTGVQVHYLNSLETIFIFKPGKGGGKDYAGLDEFIELNSDLNGFLPRVPSGKSKIKKRLKEDKLRVR